MISSERRSGWWRGRLPFVVMSWAFSSEGENYTDCRRRRPRSRCDGVAVPSDVNCGAAKGGRVGQMVIAYAMADGASTRFTGSFMPNRLAGGNRAARFDALQARGAMGAVVGRPIPGPPAPPLGTSADFQAKVAIVKNFARKLTTR